MMNAKQWVLVLMVLASMGTFGRAQAGLIYNAAADFSPTSNPNSVWSYGDSATLGGPLTAYTLAQSSTGIDFWDNTGAFNPPWVAHNGTAGVATFGTVQFLPGQLGFHPGINDEISIVRFTAPMAGSFDLSSSFSGLDFVGPTTTGVHVLLNGLSIFDGIVNGFGAGSGPSFATTLSLVAGDRVDFAVDFGPNGGYLFDSTGVSATLTVPEPASLMMLATGFIGLLSCGTRRGVARSTFFALFRVAERQETAV